jgi:hypothetical protein
MCRQNIVLRKILVVDAQTEHSLKILISSVCADIAYSLKIIIDYVLSAPTLLIISLRLCSVCIYTANNYLKTVCSVWAYTEHSLKIIIGSACADIT